jgi:hypothetical protein
LLNYSTIYIFSFYGTKRNRKEKNHFNETADIKGVIPAHRQLKKHFEEDLDEFHLAEQDLKIRTYPEGDWFYHTVNRKDFPTEGYVTFARPAPVVRSKTWRRPQMFLLQHLVHPSEPTA